MLKKGFLITVFWFFASCSGSDGKIPHIEIQTKFGDIKLELYADKAPKSVAAFLKNIDSGYYMKASFYRVLNDENQPSDAPKSQLIQGGIWKANYKLSAGASRIPHETTDETKILHKDGVISFARREPGTAGTEFFICIGDQPGLDYGGENNPDKQGYAAFGKVVEGKDVLRKIYNAPESDQAFDPPVVIFKIVKL